MRIGVLALQGAVGPHVEKLAALGVESVEVRRPQELHGLAGIILPGGESTTFLHLLRLNGLWEPLRELRGRIPFWGVCAGAILMAKEVSHPAQLSLDFMDISVERNSYGRQNESFIGRLSATDSWRGAPFEEGVFIRAPRIRSLGEGVSALFRQGEDVVMAEQGDLLVSTFHPELSAGAAVHAYFVDKCRGGQGNG